MATECEKLAEQLASAEAEGDEEKAAGIRAAMEAAGCAVSAEDMPTPPPPPSPPPPPPPHDVGGG